MRSPLRTAAALSFALALWGSGCGGDDASGGDGTGGAGTGGAGTGGASGSGGSGATSGSGGGTAASCAKQGGQCGCVGSCGAGFESAGPADCPQPCAGCGACSTECCVPTAGDAGNDGD